MDLSHCTPSQVGVCQKRRQHCCTVRSVCVLWWRKEAQHCNFLYNYPTGEVVTAQGESHFISSLKHFNWTECSWQFRVLNANNFLRSKFLREDSASTRTRSPALEVCWRMLGCLDPPGNREMMWRLLRNINNYYDLTSVSLSESDSLPYMSASFLNL